MIEASATNLCSKSSDESESLARVRRDLLRRLSLALTIAKRAIDYLAEDGFSEAERPEANFHREKPISEIAMALHVASSLRSEPHIQTQFDELVNVLGPHSRSKALALDVAQFPSVCFQLATAHILLKLIGSHDPEFDRLLHLSAKSSAINGNEVVPHRAMEVTWLRALWQNEVPMTCLESLAHETALGNPIDLLNGTREDSYAHTHAFMYFTDLGNWTFEYPRTKSEILAESSAVLAGALLAEDYDLAAEALMIWPESDTPWSPAASFGFRVVASLEDQEGFLPAARKTSTRLLELTGEEKIKYALANSYHTALVMGMLCSLALRSNSTNPFQISEDSCRPELAEVLWSTIQKNGAHWEVVFQSLERNEQAALVPFLLDVAIIQANRMGNYELMTNLLGVAFENDLANSPLCSQAAELLQRLSTCAEIKF